MKTSIFINKFTMKTFHCKMPNYLSQVFMKFQLFQDFSQVYFTLSWCFHLLKLQLTRLHHVMAKWMWLKRVAYRHLCVNCYLLVNIYVWNGKSIKGNLHYKHIKKRGDTIFDPEIATKLKTIPKKQMGTEVNRLWPLFYF